MPKKVSDSKKYFYFREFRLQDASSAMKIGTDAILLGAWASRYRYKKILDIGSGCGVIAFMLLYANKDATSTMIEIDPYAAHDIEENMQQTIFKNRCNVINEDLRNVCLNEKFDLIVSNPPYFSDDKIHPYDDRRALARHENSAGLHFCDLVKISSAMLDENGRICIIIPTDRLNDMRKFIVSCNLMIDEIVEIYTVYDTQPKRIILSVRHIDPNRYVRSTTSKLYTNNPDGTKHQDYLHLVKKFLEI